MHSQMNKLFALFLLLIVFQWQTTYMNTLMLAVLWQFRSAMLLNLLEDEEEPSVTGRLTPQVWMKVSNNNNNNNENNLIIIINLLLSLLLLLGTDNNKSCMVVV